MASNALEITVQAETGEAAKAFDDLGKSIEQIEQSTERAAASSSKWADAATDLKSSLPKSGDAAGTEKLATATLTASSATAVAQTGFQKLAHTISSLGTTAARGLTAGFSGFLSMLGTIGKQAGDLLGKAFSVAFSSTGIGAIVLAGAAIIQGLRKLTARAAAMGEEFAKAYTSSFSAGLDLSAFDEIRAAFGKMDPKLLDELASGLGALNSELVLGSDAGKQASAAFAALGGDLASLVQGGKPAAEQLLKIQDAYQQLSQMQQRDLLKLIFPDASIDSLAALDGMLEGTREALEANAGAATANAAAYAKARAEQEAAGAAASRLMQSVRNLGAALLEITHLGDAWKQVADPALLNAAAGLVDAFAAKVRSLPAIVQTGIAAVRQAFADLVTQVTATFDTLSAAISNAMTTAMDAAAAAAQAGVAKIVGVFTSMVGQIKTIWEGLLGTLKGWYDTATSWAARIRDAFSSAVGGGGGATRQAAPMQAPLGPQLFTASTGPTPSMGLFGPRITPMAMNDNMLGAGLSGTINRILYDWQNYSRAVTQAGTDSVVAGQKITQAFNAAAAATTTMASAAEESATKLSTIESVAADLQQGFQSLAQSAGGAFVDAILDGKDLASVFQNLAKQMAKMVIEALILKPLMNSLFGALGGGSGLFGAAGISAASMAPQQAGLFNAGLRTGPDVSGFSNFRGRARRAVRVSGATSVTNQMGDISIDMSGTGMVAANNEDAKRFGQEVQKAVQAILVQESRPGGLLRKAA